MSVSTSAPPTPSQIDRSVSLAELNLPAGSPERALNNHLARDLRDKEGMKTLLRPLSQVFDEDIRIPGLADAPSLFQFLAAWSHHTMWIDSQEEPYWVQADSEDSDIVPSVFDDIKYNIEISTRLFQAIRAMQNVLHEARTLNDPYPNTPVFTIDQKGRLEKILSQGGKPTVVRAAELDLIGRVRLGFSHLNKIFHLQRGGKASFSPAVTGPSSYPNTPDDERYVQQVFQRSNMLPELSTREKEVAWMNVNLAMSPGTPGYPYTRHSYQTIADKDEYYRNSLGLTGVPYSEDEKGQPRYYPTYSVKAEQRIEGSKSQVPSPSMFEPLRNSGPLPAPYFGATSHSRDRRSPQWQKDIAASKQTRSTGMGLAPFGSPRPGSHHPNRSWTANMSSSKKNLPLPPRTVSKGRISRRPTIEEEEEDEAHQGAPHLQPDPVPGRTRDREDMHDYQPRRREGQSVRSNILPEDDPPPRRNFRKSALSRRRPPLDEDPPDGDDNSADGRAARDELHEIQFDNRMKWTNIPQWDGDHDDALIWLISVTELKRFGRLIWARLGQIVPTRFTGNVLAAWLSLSEQTRYEATESWPRLRNWIVASFLQEKWRKTQQVKYDSLCFRQGTAYAKETPVEFLRRRLNLCRVFFNYDENSEAELISLVSTCPLSWQRILDWPDYDETEILLVRAIAYEDSLIMEFEQEERRSHWKPRKPEGARTANIASRAPIDLHYHSSDEEEDPRIAAVASSSNPAPRTGARTTRLPTLPPPFDKDDSVVSAGPPPGPCHACGSEKHWNQDCRHWGQFKARKANAAFTGAHYPVESAIQKEAYWAMLESLGPPTYHPVAGTNFP